MTTELPANWKRYVDKLPTDPWQHPYQYANPGVRGEVDVFSYGADGGGSIELTPGGGAIVLASSGSINVSGVGGHGRGPGRWFRRRL